MRLDKYLASRFGSRTKAARAIAEGLVVRNGKPASASDDVSETDVVEVREKQISFVSEGGFKLYKALCEFGEKVRDAVFADIGASTGGFTDCLLQCGAARVYAVDVGESQLAQSLQTDGRVVVRDRVNARYLKAEDFPERLDGITADVSFISLKLILPSVSSLLDGKGRAFVLVKPQFECGAKALDKHGIVKDARERGKAVLSVCEEARRLGLYAADISIAPIKPHKNVEFVLFLTKDCTRAVSFERLQKKLSP